jgi:hypothetical protein
MRKTGTTPAQYDIVLSYPAREKNLARVIEQQLSEAGLTVFGISGQEFESAPPLAADMADAIRDALAESRALLVVVTPQFLHSSAFAVQLGAAWASRKPTYVLLSGINPSDLPPYVRRHHLYPLAQVSDVVRQLARSAGGTADGRRGGLNKKPAVRGPRALLAPARVISARAPARGSP